MSVTTRRGPARWLKRGLAVVSLAVVGMALTAAIVHGLSIPPDCTFDAKGWAASRAARRDINARFDKSERAVRQLVECDGLVRGRTRDEVEALLGKPSPYSHGRVWSYDIGVPSGMNSDWADLEISFGVSGVVEHVSA
jgi:hypothetical protein